MQFGGIYVISLLNITSMGSFGLQIHQQQTHGGIWIHAYIYVLVEAFEIDIVTAGSSPYDTDSRLIIIISVSRWTLIV